MDITPQQKKKLKALGHALNPVVTIGQQGMKDSIHDEFELALNSHQLIKVKIAGERDERHQIIQALADQHHAAIIQTIGAKALFYRRNKDKSDLLK